MSVKSALASSKQESCKSASEASFACGSGAGGSHEDFLSDIMPTVITLAAKAEVGKPYVAYNPYAAGERSYQVPAKTPQEAAKLDMRAA